jgi:tripartite-type tricarboxylate transporter receptor subunit TctC
VKGLTRTAVRARRRATIVAVVAALLALPATPPAQAFPERPITLVVPASSGGGADAMARAFGMQLSRRLGQAVVVHNSPGASGAIAARKVLRAPPDGYTLLVGVTSELIITPLIMPAAGYSYRNFTPVSKLGGSPMALAIRARSDAPGLPALLDRARREPGRVSIAVGGSTGLGAFAAASLMKQARVRFTQVPYQGASPALVGLLGGQVDLAMLPLSSALAHVRSGDITIVALMSGQRMGFAPALPTMAEAGLEGVPDIEIWAALVGPPGLPTHIVNALNAAVTAILRDEAFAKRRSAEGERLSIPMSPGAVEAFLHAENERYDALARELGNRATR